MPRIIPRGRLAGRGLPCALGLLLGLSGCSSNSETATPSAADAAASDWGVNPVGPGLGAALRAIDAGNRPAAPTAPILRPTTPAPAPAAVAQAEPNEAGSTDLTPDPAPAAAAAAAAPPAPAVASAPAPATIPAPPPAEPGKVLSTAEIVERYEKSVALIRGKLGSGTGFVVGPGIVATNYHVIDDEFIDMIEVRFPSAPTDAAKGPLPASLLFGDPKRDLAILAVKTPLPSLSVAPSYNFRKGEDITVIGNPGMGDDMVLENAISRGVMSTKATIENLPFFQLNIAINPGNSGGPVFDPSGRVIGVLTLKAAKQEGVAFCVPVEDLNAALAKVNARPGQPVDGVAARHRALVAFKRLSSGGALFAVGLDLHKVALMQPGVSFQVGDKPLSIADFDKLLTELDTRSFGPAVAEANAMKNDKGIATSKTEKLAKLAANYAAMRSMVARPQGDANAYGNRARNLKQQHAQLVVDLGQALGAEVPEGLLATLRSDTVDAGTAVAGVGSQGTGRMNPFFKQSPRTQMDQRRQEMRDRMDQKRQDLRNRMQRAGGGDVAISQPDSKAKGMAWRRSALPAESDAC